MEWMMTEKQKLKYKETTCVRAIMGVMGETQG